MQGHRRKLQCCQEAEGSKGKAQATAFIGISLGKARHDSVNSIGLAIWKGIKAVPSCLIPGPGRFKSGEILAWCESQMLAPWKKSYDQPRQHVKKQRHYFANKSPSSQSCGFPVVMYGHESWTLKKAEHLRIDTFGLWCGRRLLRVLWTARRSNQSILKEIGPEYSLEGLMLKLKLQYFGHLM